MANNDDKNHRPLKKVSKKEEQTPDVKDLSYFDRTMSEMGVTPELNKIKVISVRDHADDKKNTFHEEEYFQEDEHGNLVINYFNLRSAWYTFRKEGNKWPINFTRTRYKEPKKDKDGKDVKYNSPYGSGLFPFFPPTIIDKYQKKEAIPLLIMTEGEKKAFKGCIDGLDIIGVPSIHGFYDDEIKGKMHEDIQDLIITCKVEKILFLMDADTLIISWEKDKDLAKRQNLFYTAVKNYRESLQLLLDAEDVPLNQIYFSHINRKYNSDGKGLDDLLINYSKFKGEIIHDLQQLQLSNKFFSCKILTDGKISKLYAYFGLDNPENFYSLYKEFIGSREFLFKGKRYEYDGEKLNYVRHEDTDKYLRIGPDWMKLIKVPNKYGELEEELIPYKIGEILRDYNQKYKNFIDDIPKYDAFCNEPEWAGTYKRIHNNCYNLCNPLNHVPEHGDFQNTIKFLKHIFRGEGNILKAQGVISRKDEYDECASLGDQFTVGLDWLTIILQQPKHMVPVPIFVSKEYRTGKSTLLKWMQAIFESNMAILGNDQFKMKFNAHYIQKFIIAIDEGFLDVDKKAEKERLKQLATADTAFLENKGMNVKKFPYYGKLIICSNDADSVMKMEDGENRWFVVKVHPIPDEELDPDLERKMKAEIPAFLNYLINRQIFHPRTDRLWFKTEWFITEQFKAIVENTKSGFEKGLNSLIQDMFLMYKVQSVKVDLKYLCGILNEELKWKVNKDDIKKYFQEKKSLKPVGAVRTQWPIGWIPGPNGVDIINYYSEMARPYELFYKDWLTQEQLQEFETNETEVEDKNSAIGVQEDLPF
jgi:hypothetical protein